MNAVAKGATIPVPRSAKNRLSLLSMTYIGGTKVRNHATVILSIRGQRTVFEKDADTVLDAAFRSLDSLACGAELIDYRVKKKGKGGTSAIAHATVVLRRNGSVAKTTGEDHDTYIASVRAYVAALEQLE